MMDSSGLKEGDKVGRYMIIKPTGKGAFSKVYHAVHEETGVNVALKCVTKLSLESHLHRDMVMNEIEIMKKIDFPLICDFYESFEDGSNFFVAMEFADNGSLLSYVNKFGKLNEDLARHCFCQLLYSIQYLHQTLGIAHRDVKTENILFDRNHNIRLIDFGFSHILKNGKPVVSGPCGSPAYAPPEVLKNQPFTLASDIWSVGIVLFAITTGHLPFIDENMSRLHQKIIYTEPKYNLIPNPELRDLLQKILRKQPNQRASFQELWDHPWVKRYPGVNYFNELKTMKRLPLDSVVISMIQNSHSPDELSKLVEKGESDDSAVSYRLLRRQSIMEKTEIMANEILNGLELQENKAGDLVIQQSSNCTNPRASLRSNAPPALNVSKPNALYASTPPSPTTSACSIGVSEEEKSPIASPAMSPLQARPRTRKQQLAQAKRMSAQIAAPPLIPSPLEGGAGRLSPQDRIPHPHRIPLPTAPCSLQNRYMPPGQLTRQEQLQRLKERQANHSIERLVQ